VHGMACLDVPEDSIAIMCSEWVDRVISGFHNLRLYSQRLESPVAANPWKCPFISFQRELFLGPKKKTLYSPQEKRRLP
jgi:hypothetical protein